MTRNSALPSAPPPVWGVALLSGVALAYEVLLTRLFSIIQWHHFAYMIISLALLGYGASGTFLTLVQARVRERFAGFFVGNALCFAVTLVASFLIAQQLPFNALEIAWDPSQLGYLLILYLLLAVPYFCVANCIGLAFIHYERQIHRIYAFDLVGAGAGALAVVVLLFGLKPMATLVALGALGLAAGGLAALECRWRLVPTAVILAAIAFPAALMPRAWITLELSEYKGLSQALEVAGAEQVAVRSSPLGLVHVLRNERIPFRYAPGLSLTAPAIPPAQLGLFSDGNEFGAITRFAGEREPLAYLDYLTSALPYHLLDRPRVLVLGAGGGADVLQALYHRVDRVDAVELNPQVVELVRRDFADFAGRLYGRDEVRVHVGEARGFITGTRQRYDLIQVALLDAFSTTSAGLYALSESYLYTVEAFRRYLDHLNPGGMLSITRWLRLPPRDGLKLFATAVSALERMGVSEPGAQLMFIRGWKTSTLVVKNGRFRREDVEALRAFCRQRSFDVAWYPGMNAVEANHFNVLEEPYLYQGALAILGPSREEFFRRYKFDVRPATDDRPYFFHFLKWRTLPELLSLRAGGGLGQLEWGYLVLVATLVQALLAGLVLILLPLWLAGNDASATGKRLRRGVLGYFLAIGLAFLFLEIAFIQKFTLYLSHPVYAVAVVLSAFLVFAGLGSGYTRRLGAATKRYLHGRGALLGAVAGILGLTLLYLAVLPAFFSVSMAWPDPVKILCAATLIAPLAFCMGMPFPLGLGWVAAAAPRLVPWAWAINGCASVVSAVLATLLAVQIGFGGVVVAAMVLYLVAATVASCISPES